MEKKIDPENIISEDLMPNDMYDFFQVCSNHLSRHKRSFSAYKNLLADNRRSFKFQNI